LPYLKKNYINYWISLTLAGYPAGYPVSGLTGYPARYPAGQSGIRPDTVYQNKRDYPAGYPVHPYSGVNDSAVNVIAVSLTLLCNQLCRFSVLRKYEAIFKKA
jgi:hypothetical protein